MKEINKIVEEFYRDLKLFTFYTQLFSHFSQLLKLSKPFKRLHKLWIFVDLRLKSLLLKSE